MVAAWGVVHAAPDNGIGKHFDFEALVCIDAYA